MTTCPYCAEEIQEHAIKCKHCNEWLSARESLENKEPPFEFKPQPITQSKNTVNKASGNVKSKIFIVWGILVVISFIARGLTGISGDLGAQGAGMHLAFIIVTGILLYKWLGNSKSELAGIFTRANNQIYICSLCEGENDYKNSYVIGNNDYYICEKCRSKRRIAFKKCTYCSEPVFIDFNEHKGWDSPILPYEPS